MKIKGKKELKYGYADGRSMLYVIIATKLKNTQLRSGKAYIPNRAATIHSV